MFLKFLSFTYKTSFYFKKIKQVWVIKMQKFCDALKIFHKFQNPKKVRHLCLKMLTSVKSEIANSIVCYRLKDIIC